MHSMEYKACGYVPLPSLAMGAGIYDAYRHAGTRLMIERPLLERARLGILAGLGYAAVYSLVAVAVFRFKDPADLANLHASLSQVVFSYVAGAVVGGALVGALLPIARWAPGAFVLGTIGTLPFFLMVFLLIASDAPWFPDQLVMALIASMLLGGLLGLFFQSQPQQ